MDNKTTVLMVYGDGDYGAMTFDQRFSAQDVYELMVEEGVTEKSIFYLEDEDEEDELYDELYVSIHEFGAVDMDFINYMVNEFLDYDSMKRKDFYVVKTLS